MLLSAEELLLFLLDEQHGTFLPITERTEDLVLAGAVLLTLMPELFRFVNDYKLLIYGALLLLVMRYSPSGLAGLADLVRRRGPRSADA